MPVVTPKFLTPGTEEHADSTRRYAIESYRVILRELSRLPRMLRDLRQVCGTDEAWREVWERVELDGDFAERLAAVYCEQLAAEDERLHEQSAQPTDAESPECIRVRREQIAHELGRS